MLTLLLILLIPIIVGMKYWRDVKLQELETLRETGTALGSDMAERTAELEKRIEVLERILTDPAHRLSGEIDALSRRDGSQPSGK